MDDAQLAAHLVRDAGTLARQMLADGLETHYKTSIADVVSAADHAAEAQVSGRLAQDRPDDGIVGEEGANRPGSRTWFIDPVDGTYNFLSGLPYWCSAVALSGADHDQIHDHDHQLIIGAVYYPDRDEAWVGGPDLPTTRNGSVVAPLHDQPLSEVSVCTYLRPDRFAAADEFEPWQAVITAAAAGRMLGSASIDLAGVATGRLGLFLQRNLAPWDWLPGAALVRGAGGLATIVPHRGINWNLAGPAQAVAEATALLRST